MASVSLVPRGDTDIQAALSTLQLNFELRRAWTARKVHFQQVEQDSSKVALADLDSLLEDSAARC